MESLGSLKNITKDWANGKFLLTFEMEQDIGSQIEEIKDQLLTVTAKKFRRRRSLDANAYYWQLITKLADRLKVSKPYLHNLMLRRYGQIEIVDGKMIYLVLPDSDDGSRRADEAETYHIKPTSEVKQGTDGMMYRTYLMLRGSSTYNTKEMSELIDGLVSECREQGIETIPPEELKRMMELYETNWRKHHEETV